jgi:hypothetical protein
LIATSSCAKITVISSVAGTTTLTVDTDLSASLAIGDKIDFLSGKAPFLLWAYDVEITAISSTQIQVATSAIVDELDAVEVLVNDYICPAGFAPIPMIPQEFHPALAQKAASQAIFSMGDQGKFQIAEAMYGQMLGAAIKLITNRVEGEPEVIMNRDGVASFIGGGLSSGNYWR